MPSSVIRSFDYDAARNELSITFVSGKVYIYQLVPRQVYEAFHAAPSKGAFFNQHIRDRYPFREIGLTG
jgi:hypothetical protein